MLLLSANTCYSQIDSTYYKAEGVHYQAGAELMRFSKIHSIGSAVETVGVIITLLSTTTISSSPQSTKDIAAVGAVISFAGVIIGGTSYKHIKRAGIALEGNGITIPLDRVKKNTR
jgi:hypothetical protein